MFAWFRRKKHADSTALEARIAALEHDAALVRAEWKSVQGRLYAVLQQRGINLKQESEGDPHPTPGRIPANASKAQVKAALGLNTPAGVAAFLRGAR